MRCRGRLADVAFGCATPDRKLRGFITAKIEGDYVRIGLLAVDPASRAKRLGSRLVMAVEEWARRRGALNGRVATHLDNVAACRFYLRRGFEEWDQKSVIHLWLANPRREYGA